MRLRGGRTGKRAVIRENLTLTGLTGSFGTKIWFDDRVAVPGFFAQTPARPGPA
jgi:hypothetical protein